MKFQLIDSAYAQAAGGAAAAPGGFDFMQFVPLVVIFVAFYFILIRPQQKKAQEQRNMIGALKVGDEVVTASGIIGRISKLVNEHEALLNVASGVDIRVLKSTIGQKLDLHTAGSGNVTSIGKNEAKSDKKPGKKPTK